jgi:GNAT superfamily N-acetyltransferase
MALPFEAPASVALLADHPHLVADVGQMRWREWGRPPEPTDLEFWVSVTGEEVGRISLPLSWVAVDGAGQAVGAVCLGEFDIEERRDRSPWVTGMIVRPDQRRRGIGRLLLATLTDWASGRGTLQVWVATGGAAVSFYNSCGWETAETFGRASAETTVLTRHL